MKRAELGNGDADPASHDKVAWMSTAWHCHSGAAVVIRRGQGIAGKSDKGPRKAGSCVETIGNEWEVRSR